MKVLAIVQARMNSVRFPRKVMQLIDGTPLIGLLLQRLSMAKTLDGLIVATSDNACNAPLIDYVKQQGFPVFAGDESDVLARYYEAALSMKADVLVRICGDCPLIDPGLVDELVGRFMEAKVDYLSNVAPPTFPDGLDTEVFYFSALKEAYEQASLQAHREHVTPYIRESGLFKTENRAHSEDYSALRWTVDEPSDLLVIQNIVTHFAPCRSFDWLEIIQLWRQSPELFEPNKQLIRNQGACMSTGQKLWKRAKQIIPGGSMLLSKRAEMFLPELWPAYFSKAKGCEVWDLDGNRFIDMSMMGIGTNSLGYAHPDVDKAVHATIDASNMCTLNCPEEVYLAERLVELHPWADMVRFARSGGEANAMAIRIARAASGKEKVAFCGYHGWHDWYLAANLQDDKSLNGHLLPGLEPKGVPSTLRDTIFPFNYNRFDELQDLVSLHDIGVIKMEVSRNHGPEPGFLDNVRELATKQGIVLIFDECTSGFRQTFGGLHKLYNVEPDIALFGKALGNGYGITAAIGRREIMEAAQTSFISSTFWTERIGPTAALKTLEVMESLRSWESITQTGLLLRKAWQAMADKHHLAMDITGIPALSSFSIKGEKALAYKTLITQEMLAAGFLASTSVYTSIAHTPAVLEQYFAALEPVFALIAECEAGRDVLSLLKGPVCHAGFKRIN